MSNDRYAVQERGNRAAPQPTHPRYWSLKLLQRHLKEIVEASAFTSPADTILDYGCGNRPYRTLLLEKYHHYVGADFPGNDAADVCLGPRGALPLDALTVDGVLSTQVLEHVEDPQFYLAEAYRVLKPGGSLILSTHGTWPYHPDPTDYWRWTVDGLRYEVDTAGFDVWKTKSVFGLASCAIQLWQDATLQSIPHFMRSSYVRLLQSAIGFIERRNTMRLSLNASIYIIAAKKRGTGGLASGVVETRQLSLAMRELAVVIPDGARVILVDQDEIGPSCLPNCEVIPFTEKEGQYNGPPKDDRDALIEFERLQRAGAEYLVFTWPAFWWLDHYTQFVRRLRSKAICVVDNDRIVVFGLKL